MVRSVVKQTLHYLARPHQGVPVEPIAGAGAWVGDALRPGDWLEVLSDDDVAELEAALDCSAHIPMEDLTAKDFPLPKMAPRIAAWKRVLTEGVGFRVLRGLPVERWGEERSSRFFWAFGQHLGLPGAQDPQGSLLGHVRDEGLPPGEIRAYRTREAIAYHCDAADVVGLLCLETDPQGGLSRLVSSVSVFNALLAESPVLAARLFEPMWLDTRGDSAFQAVPVYPCRHYKGRLRTFYHTDYFRSAGRHPAVPDLSDTDLATLDAYERIANTEGMYLDMRLEVGDVQLVHNHTLLHARTAYAAGSGRHLLRLWLSLEDPHSRSERMARRISHWGTLYRLARQGLRERLV